MVDELVIPPLGATECAELARRLHPDLSAAQHGALIDAAAGNPLLIEYLALDGDVSASVRDAVMDRIASLPDDVVDELGRLALLEGLPAATDLMQPLVALGGGLTFETDDGRIWFSHELLGSSVRSALGADRLDRLRRELVTQLPPAEACRHLLELGERTEAARMACVAAAGSDPTTRADLLALAVDALGDEASTQLLLGAAAAAIDAHRSDDARRFATAVRGDDAAMAAAGLRLARAAWLDGDARRAAGYVADALTRVRGTDTGIESELLVEQAFIAVRHRVGDPEIVELADAAVEVVTRSGSGRARALNTAGLARSHIGRSGWRELFEKAARAAAEEGDGEELMGAKYWLLSALGFYGPMPDAIAVGAEMIDDTSRIGARRWYHHFLGAHLVHLSSRGDVPRRRVAEAHAMLLEAPRFRNRAQVELALVAAHLDSGEIEECLRLVAAGDAMARGGEDLALLACARCEIALATRDVVAMNSALGTIRESGVAFFGLNAVAESAAIHLALGCPGLVEPPTAVTTLTPVLDVVRIEREALDRQLAGDIEGALDACRDAAEEWFGRGLDRFGRRARLAEVEIVLGAGDLDRAERLLGSLDRSPPDVTSRRRVFLVAEIGRRRARALLTPRELQVLELVGQGLTSRQIAADLGIGASTVDSHVDAARRRLGARTRVHAASMIRG